MNESSDKTSHCKEVPLNLPGLELVRKIGSGSYGQVWLGRNRVTGQLAAVKVVPVRPLEGPDRAGREAASLIHYEVNRRKQHENLLPIYHVGQTEEVLYYTMEPADDVRGRPASLDPDYRPSSLAARLEGGPVPLEEAYRFAQELLKGLACLHDAGMAHRDVKPANCLFVDGRLKLADFGLLTRTDGTVSLVGTPRYMPPDKHMDARADVYAAGLVIYEMFTGLPASSFPRWDADSLREKDNPILAALNRAVLKACQAEPEKRFKDAREMLSALEAVGSTIRSGRARTAAKLAVLFGLALAVAATAVGWWWSSMSDRTANPALTDVNFITVPFEAEIYLDGVRAADAKGAPYVTPCTVPGLSVRSYRVLFRKSGFPDLDVGVVDFSPQREVQVRWHILPEP